MFFTQFMYYVQILICIILWKYALIKINPKYNVDGKKKLMHRCMAQLLMFWLTKEGGLTLERFTSFKGVSVSCNKLRLYILLGVNGFGTCPREFSFSSEWADICFFLFALSYSCLCVHEMICLLLQVHFHIKVFYNYDINKC